MIGHDALSHREPNPNMTGLGCDEGFERSGQDIRCDDRTRVLQPRFPGAIGRYGGDNAKVAALGRGFDRVDERVAEGLSQLLNVDVERVGGRRRGVVDEQGFAFQCSAMRLQNVDPHVVGNARAEADGGRSRELEQGRDEGVQSLRFAHDASDVPLDERIVGDAIAEQLGRRRDPVDRVSQLVRDGRREVLRDLDSSAL